MRPILWPERTKSQMFKGEEVANVSGKVSPFAETINLSLGQPDRLTRLALLFVPTKTIDVVDEWTIVQFKKFRGVNYIVGLRRYR